MFLIYSNTIHDGVSKVLSIVDLLMPFAFVALGMHEKLIAELTAMLAVFDPQKFPSTSLSN